MIFQKSDKLKHLTEKRLSSIRDESRDLDKRTVGRSFLGERDDGGTGCG